MERAIADSDEVGWMGARIVTMADRENAAVYEMLGFIREFDRCRGWARDGIASCAEWLQRFAGLADGKARERVRVAHALGTFGAIDAALHDGTLSYSKVRAIVRVATADNEAALINGRRSDHTPAARPAPPRPRRATRPQEPAPTGPGATSLPGLMRALSSHGGGDHVAATDQRGGGSGRTRLTHGSQLDLAGARCDQS